MCMRDGDVRNTQERAAEAQTNPLVNIDDDEKSNPISLCLYWRFLSLHTSFNLMFFASIAFRRSSLLLKSSPIFRPCAPRAVTPFTRLRFFSQSSSKMGKDHSQDQGESTSGISEWKTKPPYLVHDKNSDFDVKYEANCHCGKVKYQLSRREPLDSKLCHCTTCQTQHGTHRLPFHAPAMQLLT